MRWLWGAQTVEVTNGAAPGLLALAAPWALYVLLMLAITGALWLVLCAGNPARGSRPPSDAQTAWQWWLVVVASDALRRLTPWGGDYGSLSLATPDLPGAAAWIPWVGGQGAAWWWNGVAAATAWLASRIAARSGCSRWQITVLGAGLMAWCWLPLKNGTHELPSAASFAAITPAAPATVWSVETRDARVAQLLETAPQVPADSVLVTSEGYFGDPPPDPPAGLWLDLVEGLERRQVHALVGLHVLAHDNQRQGAMNAVLQLSPRRQAVYGKGLLAPVGESLPWSEVLMPVYQRVFGSQRPDLLEAPDALRAPLYAAGVSMALALCHEMAFDTDLARRAREANVIVSQSDDSWTNSQAYRHQVTQMARLRALENGKPLLRVSEGSATLLADPAGRVHEWPSDARVVPIVGRAGQTPYSVGATVWTFIPWGLLGTYLFFGMARRGDKVRRTDTRRLA